MNVCYARNHSPLLLALLLTRACTFHSYNEDLDQELETKEDEEEEAHVVAVEQLRRKMYDEN